MSIIGEELRLKIGPVLQYHFKNADLLEEALTHASIAEHRLSSNERLEFLGDAILGAIVCEHLYHRYPEFQEGELTKIKSAVVSRRVCAELANKLGLVDFLNLGKGMPGHQQLPSSLAAAVYESLVAAIYLDGGLDAARNFIMREMAAVVEEAGVSAHQQNYKSVLQQHAQKQWNELPSYCLLDERGPDHSKEFLICVEIQSRRYPPAWGANKKEAEQKAALLTLEALQLVEVDGDGRVVMCAELEPGD